MKLVVSGDAVRDFVRLRHFLLHRDPPPLTLPPTSGLLHPGERQLGKIEARSPDGAKRNPGLFNAQPIPDVAALHPGYGFPAVASAKAGAQHAAAHR